MRYKKSYAVKMTPPDWTKEDRTAYVWCITNDIKISAEAKSSGHNELWDIIIKISGAKIVSPKSYGPKDLYPKMLELYKFYYKKYNK
jgi:hypothetical protein|tara:strand:- start:74 stop:334 length:261 start_codon:yes stop_codon:yes gene_type:complete